MRFTAYVGNNLFFDTNSDDQDLMILNPNVQVELNKTGSFTFKVLPSNAYYNSFYKLKSVIRVYRNNNLIFRGRVLTTEQGFHNERQVTCEGELAFLLDSKQRPYSFEGTVSEYFEQLISNHNLSVANNPEKQFVIGTCNVTDGDTTNTDNIIIRSDTNIKSTWDIINEKLIDPLGGYLWVDNDANGNRRINYISDFDTLSSQSVEYSKNLLDLTQKISAENIVTALIPLGTKINRETVTEERIDISDLDDDYQTSSADIVKKGDLVYSKSAVQTYGWIEASNTWDNVTDASNLLSKAKAYLATRLNPFATVEINAVDLSFAYGNVGSFFIGSYVRFVSGAHPNVTENGSLFLIKRMHMDLFHPSMDTLTVGSSYSTFTEQTHDINKNIENVRADVTNETNKNLTNAIREIIEQNNSSIEQMSDQIMSLVSQNYYLKNETDTLVQSVSTELTQTKNSFNFQFSQFSKDLTNVQNGSDAKFQEINRYIRFVDGNIILGEEGNNLTLRIENDRISFLQSVNEVAYFSNNKLYVTDGEFINSLRSGTFAFLPRKNGNLSFKKVG